MQSTSRTLFAAVLLAGSGLPLAAQSGGRCGPFLDSFLIEHPVDITTIKSALTPHFDPAALAGYFAGTQEIRSRNSYNATTNILTNDLFLVSKGAPNPTPATVDIGQIRFGYLVVYVNNVYLACKPAPAALLTGVIAAGVPIFAAPAGAPYAFSFAYSVPGSTNGPIAFATTVRDVVSDSAGLSLLYAGSVNATVNVTGAAPSPLSVKLTAGGTAPGSTPVMAAVSPLQLDATATTDANHGLLSYQWTSDMPVAFWPNSKSPEPQLTFQNGAGNYKISLLVKSSAGVTAMTSFVVTYSGATN